MSWDAEHSESERHAVAAESALRSGDRDRALGHYREAAAAEEKALGALSPDKTRTRGITAVSAVALWYKATEFSHAEQLAHASLAMGNLPWAATKQLRDLLSLVWTAESARIGGVRFVPGDVLVSVKGGRIIYGGAPLDMIVQKVEGIQAVLYRTVEMLLGRSLRQRGAPASDVQSMFTAWLCQVPAGSYQFAVRVQEPEQSTLWDHERPKVEMVTAKFLSVLRATAGDPERELPEVVSDPAYRGAFLSLARNLAPTGKAFERIEVRDPSGPADAAASFGVDTRHRLNEVLRRQSAHATPERAKPEEIRGILRALHLDKDWLEILLDGDLGTAHIADAGDVLDDVVGPMVNRRVVVSALRAKNKLTYRDIQLDE